MKVYELIQKLSKYPADTEVGCRGNFYIGGDINPEAYDLSSEEDSVYVEVEFNDSLEIGEVEDDLGEPVLVVRY